MSVNLGPIAPGSPSLKVPANPQRDGFGYNPSEFTSLFSIGAKTFILLED